jgi:hypothetical protein
MAGKFKISKLSVSFSTITQVLDLTRINHPELGDELIVTLDEAPSEDGQWNVRLTGPVEIAFSGEWNAGQGATAPAGTARTRA